MTDGIENRKVWVVRHGFRMDFLDKEWVKTADRPYDPPLHPLGMEQAEETAERLKAEKIDWIFTSPFYRTLQTAEIIGKALNKEVRVEAGLSEWLTARDFKYKPVLHDLSELDSEMTRLQGDYRSFSTPGFPEEEDALDERTGRSVQTIIDSCEGNILFISHASPIGSIYKAMTGKNREAYQPMASVTRFDRIAGGWELAVDGDSSHLSTPDRTERAFYHQWWDGQGDS